jgi:hypothetical protein
MKTIHAIRVSVEEVDIDAKGKVLERRSTLSHYEGGWPDQNVIHLFNKLADLIVAERKSLSVEIAKRPLKSHAAKGVRAHRARGGSRHSGHDR